MPPRTGSRPWTNGCRPKDREIARRILKEIRERLGFLNSVGLDYLTLSRTAGTLSGGESQRIRLASQIGSGLTGVLYVLDEPSIGLHQRDNDRLLETLKNLRDQGNTVIVVEHDEEAIRAADYIWWTSGRAQASTAAGGGPGHPDEVIAEPGQPDRPVPDRATRGGAGAAAPGNGKAFTCGSGGHAPTTSGPLRGHSPGNKFICVTGVSGGGKSTLVIETLLRPWRGSLMGRAPGPRVARSRSKGWT